MAKITTMPIIPVCLAFICSISFAAAAELKEPTLTPEYESDLFASVEERYEMLQEGLKDSGFGEISEIQLPEKIGYSEDISALFKERYGDINKTTLSQQKIPESFNVSEIMDNASNIRSKALGDFKASESYKNVINAISIGNVFEAAEQAKMKPALLSSETMNSMLQASFSSVKENAGITSDGSSLATDLSEYKSLVNTAKEADEKALEEKWDDLRWSGGASRSF